MHPLILHFISFGDHLIHNQTDEIERERGGVGGGGSQGAGGAMGRHHRALTIFLSTDLSLDGQKHEGDKVSVRTE